MPQWPFFLDVKNFSQPNTLNVWITGEKKEDYTHIGLGQITVLFNPKYASDFNLFYSLISFNQIILTL